MARNIKILDRQFVPAGTLVIEQGTIGNRAFVIEKGKVEVFVKDANGNTVIIAELGPESMIGEMAVITNGERSASVRTTEDTVLITISAHELRESMGSSESAFNRIMRLASERLKDTSMKLLKKERKLATIDKASPLALKSTLMNAVENGAGNMHQEAAAVDRKLVPAGTLVIEQGTMGTNAFLIESGTVEVFIKDGEGNKVILAELGPKALIGEISALVNKPRSASVRALEDTVLIPISAGDLREIIDMSDGLHKKLIKMMMDRMKDTSQKLFGKKDN